MKRRTLKDSSRLYLCYKCDVNMIIESLSSGGKFRLCVGTCCTNMSCRRVCIKGIHWYKNEPEDIREYKLTNKARRGFLEILFALDDSD